MSLQAVADQTLPRSFLPFSPAVRAGDFLFVSGQASVDDQGKIVSESFEGEMRRAMSNLRRILQGAALDLKDVVQVRAYVDDPADLPEYNRLYREYFTSPFPARSTLVGCLGKVIKFEIDVMAYYGNAQAL